MNKQDNLDVNFSLKGNASIQIGIYFLLAVYLIKTLLDGFLMGTLSGQSFLDLTNFSGHLTHILRALTDLDGQLTDFNKL